MRRLAVLFVCALALPVSVAQAWTWPVDGPVLRPFSFDRDRPYTGGQHRGIDLGAPSGAPVLAPAEGIVSFAGTVPTGGRTVSIETPFGYTATLLHLGSIGVRRGALVDESSVVGSVGPSGVVDLTEPYVYFGVRVTAEAQGYVDPLSLLPARRLPSSPAPEEAAVEHAAQSEEAASQAVPLPDLPSVAPAVEAAAAAPETASAQGRNVGAVSQSTPVGVAPAIAGPKPSALHSETEPVQASLRTVRAVVLPKLTPEQARSLARSTGAAASPSFADAAPTPVPAPRLRSATVAAIPVGHRLIDPQHDASSGEPKGGFHWLLPAGIAAAAVVLLVTLRLGLRSGPLDTLPIMESDELLRHHTDLLRQLDASHRPRVHDDRGRHPRAPSPATGRGDVLSHGDGRARLEGLPGGRGAGDRSEAYVDQIVESWKELPRLVDADYDFFIRTTDEGHKRFVQDFIQRIYDNGYIYQDVYAGLYCVGCEAFKTEAELVDGKCPDHGIVPEWIEEKNYFFKLSAFQDRLLELYDARPDFVLPQFRYNEARSFIEGGLQDFSLSRAGQPWGVPVPWDESQVVYVWVDALINYVSALTYAREGEDLRDKFWPEVRHLLAKDILRFHCVFWPALLLAADYEVPKQFFVHGYLQLDDRKISKSLGNVIDTLDLVDVYGSDAVRFWAARAVQFGQDGNFTQESLHDRYERELANDLGNLVSRTTAMIARYRDGRLVVAPGDSGLLEKIAAVSKGVPERLDVYDITGALDVIWELVRALNRHVEQTKPWELAKDEARADELDRVLYDLADGVRVAAVALSAYLPRTAPQILRALRQPEELGWQNVAYGRTAATEGIEPAVPLFPRVDAATAAA